MRRVLFKSLVRYARAWSLVVSAEAEGENGEVLGGMGNIVVVIVIVSNVSVTRPEAYP